MGKEKRGRQNIRKNLAGQILDDQNPEIPQRYRKPKTDKTQQRDEYLDDNLSKKTLGMARQQVHEEEMEANKRFQNDVDFLEQESDDSESDSYSEYEEEEIFIDPDDEATLSRWMNRNPEPRQTIADLIMEKIREYEQGGKTVEEHVESRLDPKIVKVYKGVGRILSTYRSGKIPKAFKIIPSVNNWEELIYLTDPAGWTPQAMAYATRLFASNLKEAMAQRFYHLVLMPAVRDDIDFNGKLNYHYYMALKKSLFKPGAFYKGFLLPLCEEGTCTLREATIIGSVLAKVSIPVLQSSVALLKLAEMEYSGANSMFIRILLDKKYALPYRVIDALVVHFCRFAGEEELLPVLWHQALLVFCQRYKGDLTVEQKEALKVLMRHQVHHSITPECRREIGMSKSREDEMELAMTANDTFAFKFEDDELQMDFD